MSYYSIIIIITFFGSSWSFHYTCIDIYMIPHMTTAWIHMLFMLFTKYNANSCKMIMQNYVKRLISGIVEIKGEYLLSNTNLNISFRNIASAETLSPYFFSLEFYISSYNKIFLKLFSKLYEGSSASVVIYHNTII